MNHITKSSTRFRSLLLLQHHKNIFISNQRFFSTSQKDKDSGIRHGRSLAGTGFIRRNIDLGFSFSDWNRHKSVFRCV